MVLNSSGSCIHEWRWIYFFLFLWWCETNSFLCMCVHLCVRQLFCTLISCLVLRDSCFSTELRILKSISLPFFLHLQWIGLFCSCSPQPQPNCNLKSTWCKYCYCWRRNQTFMRERDLGRGRESRSRMRWQVSEAAASLSLFFFSLSFRLSSTALHRLHLSPAHLSLLLSSFVFLYSISPLSFCLLIAPKLITPHRKAFSPSFSQPEYQTLII